MRQNFDAVMEQVFKHEGGYVNDKRDPGGETKYGISKRAHPREDIRGLTKERAREIYRASYWKQVRGDDLNAGVDLAVMDVAVNSGVSRGGKLFQQALGFKGTSVDGQIGPKTLKAHDDKNPVELVKAICARRMSFLKGLRTWKTFSKGWSRRVAEVEAVGVRMALDGMRKPAPVAAAVLEAEKIAAQGAASKAATATAAAGGGAIAAPVAVDGLTTAATQFDGSTPSLIAAAILAIVALFTNARRGHARDRARAYDAQAVIASADAAAPRR